MTDVVPTHFAGISISAVPVIFALKNATNSTGSKKRKGGEPDLKQVRLFQKNVDNQI